MSSFNQYFPSAYFVGGVGGAEVKESAMVRGRILAVPEEGQDGMICGQSRGLSAPSEGFGHHPRPGQEQGHCHLHDKIGLRPFPALSAFPPPSSSGTALHPTHPPLSH